MRKRRDGNPVITVEEEVAQKEYLLDSTIAYSEFMLTDRKRN